MTDKRFNIQLFNFLDVNIIANKHLGLSCQFQVISKEQKIYFYGDDGERPGLAISLSEEEIHPHFECLVTGRNLNLSDLQKIIYEIW